MIVETAVFYWVGGHAFAKKSLEKRKSVNFFNGESKIRWYPKIAEMIFDNTFSAIL